VSTERSALHPSQTLEREEHAMQDLVKARVDAHLSGRPSLMHWTAED